MGQQMRKISASYINSENGNLLKIGLNALYYTFFEKEMNIKYNIFVAEPEEEMFLNAWNFT
jgi:hypothetical protein